MCTHQKWIEISRRTNGQTDRQWEWRREKNAQWLSNLHSLRLMSLCQMVFCTHSHFAHDGLAQPNGTSIRFATKCQKTTEPVKEMNIFSQKYTRTPLHAHHKSHFECACADLSRHISHCPDGAQTFLDSKRVYIQSTISNVCSIDKIQFEWFHREGDLNTR